MKTMKALLGTTALVGAGLMLGTPASVEAATVSPGGALDLTLTGFYYFRAHGGDLQNARLNNSVSNGLDFSNDTEFHVVSRAKHDATGIEYGATIEFEADTDSALNTDETWLFMRGGFGEFRFGDEDGVTDNSKVGGQTIAAGTGGIDGSIVDAIAANVIGPTNSGDSTKVRYYTPSFGGFSLGVSYSPNAGGGSSIARSDAETQDFIEGAAVYDGSFGGVDLLASLVGGTCRIEDGEDNCHTVMGGAAITLWGFKIAAGYGSEHIRRTGRDWANAGIGFSFGPVNTSLTYGTVIDGESQVNGNDVEDPQNLVLSADIGLMPGMVLAGDVGWFDNDVKSGPAKGDDDGVQVVGRLGVNF